MSFFRDLRVAFYSLQRTQGLALTVILTLALGLGANGAIFTLVRGVLLKPLVNRDEDRLIYIRQSAPGIREDNSTFSVPEIQDLRGRVKTLSAFGDFSTTEFTMIGLGEPRVVQSGVVSGTFFEVMGLHPVLGRLIQPQDDNPKAPGVAVLAYRFWTTALNKDPSVLGKTVRLDSGLMGDRTATVIGVLEPSIPYPQDTEIIANIVTSPHHLSATMVTGRVHRMTELFGRLAPGVTLDQARAELRSVYGSMTKQHPEAYPPKSEFQIGAKLLRDQITSRRQRIFAVTQIAASFVLLAGASTVITTLIALQTAQTGLDMRHVLTINVPPMAHGKTPQQVVDFYKESIRRIDALPGVNQTAFGLAVPWRDFDGSGFGMQFSADGHVHILNEDPRAQMRVVSPGFFASLGVPILSGRDFNELDGQKGTEPVAIVSETLAKTMFPNQDAVGRHVYWTDPVLEFAQGVSAAPHRIIGVTADIDDEHVVPEPVATIYGPFQEGPLFGGRLFIHTSADPYSLVTPVTRLIRDMSADQPVEHAATLEDVRAEVLTPHRLNSLVFGVFAAVALTIALVGVAGVLAFSVSARTREFGIRLALGSQPRTLLKGVIAEGAVMAGAGVLAGAAFGFVLARLARSYFFEVKMPGALPVIFSAFVLLAAAVVASWLPAARAARIDVIQALRSE